MATIIDGNATAATIREELKKEVAELKERTGKVPGLGVVLVGARKDSETYVRMKGATSSHLEIYTCARHITCSRISHSLIICELWCR